eukprot:scaffold73973_cov65-Phaeocystis_antarctica.AAC.2
MGVDAAHRDVPDRTSLVAHAPLDAFAAAARMCAHFVSQGVMSNTRNLCGQCFSVIAFVPVLKHEKARMDKVMRLEPEPAAGSGLI